MLRICGTCAWCDRPFVSMGKGRGWPKYCSNHCLAATRKRAMLRSRIGGQPWRWSDFMRIARAFGYCCAYCGVKPDRLDADHVVPIARGGNDSISNILPTCLMCNSHKRDLTLEEWATDRELRGLPPRRTRIVGAQYAHLALPPAKDRVA